ncbi:hypothetical protein JCM8097_007174 [Rhodosporidiobolus ruineniae]
MTTQLERVETAYPPAPQPAALPPSPPLTPARQLARLSFPAPAESNEVQAASKKEQRQEWFREAACFFATFVSGWSDASSGPLIPYMQAHYKISYTVVSMLFVGTMGGCLVAASTLGTLARRFGIGKVMTCGAILQTLVYSLLVPAFPWPAYPTLYVGSGFGVALQMALCNVYISSMKNNADRHLGFLHAFYGLGAVVSPLAATAIASHGVLFARFYGISAGLAAISLTLITFAFKFSYRMDMSDDVPPAPQTPLERTGPSIELSERGLPSPAPSTLSKIDGGREAEEGRATVPTLDTSLPTATPRATWRDNQFVRVFSQRATLCAAFFVWFYVGSEVATGGWLVTFLQQERAGGDGAGWVSAGYWGGLCAGRIVLLPVTAWIGEQRALPIYTASALLLEFAIWFRNDFIGNSVVVSIIGLLMGPSYPILVSILTKLIPRRLHNETISIVAACGQIGSAVFPFVTGALAERFSPAALPAVMIVLLAGQLAAWFGMPKVARKAE